MQLENGAKVGFNPQWAFDTVPRTLPTQTNTMDNIA